jgi:hypothetical protein
LYIKNNVQRQPYIICLSKLDDIPSDTSFYIAIDEYVIKAPSFLRAFEILYKAHYVFNLEYEAPICEKEFLSPSTSDATPKKMIPLPTKVAL